jgi:hypothetical protein
MNRFLFYLGLPIVAVFALTACNEEDDLPNEPVINSVDYMPDSKELVIVFTDGDGNFGLPSEMVSPPFQAWEDSSNNVINRYHNNLWLEVYVREQGTYQLLEVDNDYGFDFRIPELTPKGQNKQLRVTATYDLAFDLEAIAESDLLDYGDTLRFNVVLIDRDLNESNMVESEGHVLTQ